MNSVKRNILIIFLAFIMVFASVFSACNPADPTKSTVPSVPELTTKSEKDHASESTVPTESSEVPTETQRTPGSSDTETMPPTGSEVKPPETQTIPPTESQTVPPTEPQTQPQPSITQDPTIQPSSYSGGPLDNDSDPEVLYARAEALHQEKAIYITFDDGPSYLTEGLLDVLDQHNVKATFFVVYKPEYEAVYKDIVSRGHALGVHCAIHDYDHLYKDFESWKTDFDQLYNYLKDTIGYTTHLYRFPGGSLRQLEWKDQIIAYLKSLNIVYWDWNVVTEDGDQHKPKEEIMENAVQGTHRILPVILSHDGDMQDVSVSCIPEILEFYLEKGFTFRVLDSSVPPIQQGKGHHWDYYRE